MNQQRYNTNPHGRHPATEKVLAGRSDLKQHQEVREREEPKASLSGFNLGKNKPCQCGSGKKRKRCCGA